MDVCTYHCTNRHGFAASLPLHGRVQMR
jgi:hypothetical protein